MRMNKKSNLPLYLAFAGVIIMALIVRTYVFNIRKIEGDSMSPNLKNGDIVFVSMLSKNFKQGDVVIFNSPFMKDTVLIKRVIAGPNTKVFIDDYKVIANDNLVESIVLSKSISLLETMEGVSPQNYFTQWKLNSLYCRYSEIINSKTDEYIMFGDNRCSSSDSRVFGAVPAKSIIGKVVYTLKLPSFLYSKRVH